MFNFLLLFLFIIASLIKPLNALNELIPEPIYWTEYTKEADLTKKNYIGLGSFEIMGLAYDFKLAKKYFAKTFNEIRHVTLITPLHQKTTTIIPIILIKGTWVKDDDFCRADNKFFKGFLKFAKDIAESKGSRVELVTFSWNASNQNKDRKQAAKRLAQFINTHYPNEQTHPLLYFLGHSHGGSVANAATHFIKRDISDLINLATPVRYNPCFKPSRYKRFYQFYIEGDVIQWLGAGGRVKSKHLSPRRYTLTELHANKKFHCIYTKIDGFASDHYHIKLLSYKLADILELINKHHEKHASLVVNIVHNHKLYSSHEHKKLKDKHPILIAPYIPKKQFTIHQEDTNPEFSAHQAHIFKKLYHGKQLTGRNRFIEIAKNISLFIGYACKNTLGLLRRICNPKLSKIPGSED